MIFTTNIIVCIRLMLFRLVFSIAYPSVHWTRGGVHDEQSITGPNRNEQDKQLSIFTLSTHLGSILH